MLIAFFFSFLLPFYVLSSQPSENQDFLWLIYFRNWELRLQHLRSKGMDLRLNIRRFYVATLGKFLFLLELIFLIGYDCSDLLKLQRYCIKLISWSHALSLLALGFMFLQRIQPIEVRRLNCVLLLNQTATKSLPTI